jgi:formamidopyrimidine-DNA glycosylase
MAELPELEILRRDLDKDVAGKKVKQAEVLVPATVKRNTNKKLFAARVDGMKITSGGRIGNWLTLGLESGEVMMIVLGPKAHLRRTQAKDPKEKGTLVIITFTQHGQLRLVDTGKGSEMFVVPAEEVGDVVGPLGFDLVEEPVSWTAFGEQLLRRQGKLKSILMDTTFLVGVGPMYSDEILFESGLRPDRSPQSLSTQEIRRLYRATVEKIHDALKYGGSSVGEDGFTDLNGKRGEYQSELAVYQRDGEMSPRARGLVVKTRFGSGYAYYCEQTQM